ncbi:TPA: Ig-like domain-containing protein, partial [Aeromonas dhakensis]|nr:Ig-like domain-containing protein [Aeromonas dhakensis]
QVTPTNATTPVGLEKQFTAVAVMSDDTTVDVTHDAAVAWSSSDTAIATIAGNGKATGVTPGVVTITASGEH